MTDLPMIFSAPMVRALIANRKTQTRRIFVPPAPFDVGDDIESQIATGEFKPKYAVGDLLWVRETFVIESTRSYSEWATDIPSDGRPIRTESAPDDGSWKLIPHYRATEPEPHIVSEAQDPDDDRTRWKSPIHMPRWASRLTLTVTDVRIERLNDINEEDAIAEGAYQRPDGLWTHCGDLACGGADSIRHSFAMLWCDIHGNDSWFKANPFVVALTFDIAHANIDTLPKSEAA